VIVPFKSSVNKAARLSDTELIDLFTSELVNTLVPRS